jgi:solute carrier family 25 protein 14/30
LKTFYKGITAAYFREMTYTSLRLGLYSPVKDLYAGKGNTPSAFVKFMAGATSGALAASAGNPFDVLKTRMMANEGKNLGLGTVSADLYKS